MSFVRNPKVDVRQAPPEFAERAGGPITPVDSNPPRYQQTVRSVRERSRLEKVGFWIVVAAAFGLLLLLLGVFLPRFVGGLITGADIGLFVGLLTLMNLPRPSGWGNALFGRQVFPVLKAPGNDIWRLAATNAVMVFVFTFLFEVVASFIGAFFGGILVFGALIAAAVFFSRVRTVIVKP